MAELQHIIFGMAMGKAPGAAGILAEIWRPAGSRRDRSSPVLGSEFPTGEEEHADAREMKRWRH